MTGTRWPRAVDPPRDEPLDPHGQREAPSTWAATPMEIAAASGGRTSPPDDLPADLMEQFDAYERILRPVRALGWLGVVGAVFVAAAAVLWSRSYAGAVLDVLALTILAAGILLNRARKSQYARDGQGIIDRLDTVDSVGAAGALIDRLHYPDPVIQAAISRRLAAILAQFSQDDWAALTSARQQALISRIGNYYLPTAGPLHTAILPMIGRCGDKSALGALYRVSRMDARTAQDPAIREAARTALEELAQRVDFGGAAKLPQMLDELPIGEYQRSRGQALAISLLGIIQVAPTLSKELYYQALDQKHRRRLQAILFLSTLGSISSSLYLLRELVIALIRAICVGEDVSAIRMITRIAGSEAATAAEHDIRAEARRALPLLRAAAAREQVSGTLLRASSVPEPAVRVLLRPAAGALPTRSAELLRPSEHATDRASTPVEQLRESVPPVDGVLQQ